MLGSMWIMSERSEYDFRDGIIRIRRKHVELWKKRLRC